MRLKERIQDDMKAALLSGDRFLGETLRGLKAAILNEEVALNKRDEGLEDSEIEQIIAKEVKKRNESARLYAENGREESAADETREAEVLRAYLPTRLTEDELRAVVNAEISQLGASEMADMGRVIGGVKSKVGLTADGALLAQIVKQALTK